MYSRTWIWRICGEYEKFILKEYFVSSPFLWNAYFFTAAGLTYTSRTSNVIRNKKIHS